MSIKIGTTDIDAVYKGTTSIDKIYKGTTLVFQKWDETLGGLGIDFIGGDTLGSNKKGS